MACITTSSIVSSINEAQPLDFSTKRSNPVKMTSCYEKPCKSPSNEVNKGKSLLDIVKSNITKADISQSFSIKNSILNKQSNNELHEFRDKQFTGLKSTPMLDSISLHNNNNTLIPLFKSKEVNDNNETSSRKSPKQFSFKTNNSFWAID